MSSLLSTSRVLSSACVLVFIFYVTFLIPASVSLIPPVFIMYSMYRLNRPGDKIHPCLIPFLDWEPFCYAVVKLHFASYCVGLVLTLPNAWVFPHLLCCSTFLNAAHYENLCVFYKTDLHICGAPLRCP